MDNLQSINGRPAGPPVRPEHTRSQPEQHPTTAEGAQEDRADRVELSEAARAYDPQAEAARAMERRINEVRAAIDEGTYLTPEKIDAVVERLFQELARQQSTPKA